MKTHCKTNSPQLGQLQYSTMVKEHATKEKQTLCEIYPVLLANKIRNTNIHEEKGPSLCSLTGSLY